MGNKMNIELECYKRQLQRLMIDGNRMIIHFAPMDADLFQEALNHLVKATMAIETLEDGDEQKN